MHTIKGYPFRLRERSRVVRADEVLFERPSANRHRVQPLPKSVETASKAMLRREGLSLLEVVLALSILGIATAILSSIMQQATDNGLKSRRMTQAQMVCEAKLAEAVSGSLPLQVTTWTPTISADGSNWYYAMELVPAEVPNMIGIAISVNDDTGMSESQQRPLSRLVQWIIDPNLGLDTKPAATTDETSGTTSGTTTGATP